MKINDFLQKYVVKVSDIKSNFSLSHSKNIDYFHHKGCFNCDNDCDMNQFFVKSESTWVHIQVSNCCKSINVIYETDRMSGVYTDLVEIYKEDNKVIENRIGFSDAIIK